MTKKATRAKMMRERKMVHKMPQLMVQKMPQLVVHKTTQLMTTECTQSVENKRTLLNYTHV